ncbi:MAG: hypothetical protein AB7F43_06580 [Bacteriovoracia bacterium]
MSEQNENETAVDRKFLHDLSTPISTALLLVDCIEIGDDDAKKMLDQIKTELLKITLLINSKKDEIKARKI